MNVFRHNLNGLCGLGLAGMMLLLSACSSGGGDTPPAPAPAASVTLTVATAGGGTGTVTSNPAGLNCGTTCTLTVSSGSVVTLTAAPAPSNTLTDWGGVCPAGSATCAVTVTANQTVTATFTPSSANPTLGFTFVGTGTGSVTCNGGACNASYPWGTSVTVSGVANPNSSFAGWSGGGCTGTTDCTVLLWANTQVTATFNLLPVTAQLTVNKAGSGTGTVTSAPAGINCGVTCSANYAGGTVVTLTAASAVGSTFAGWSGGGCTGTGTCNVSLNANTAVTATFNTVPPTVTLATTMSGTGTGTVSCNGGVCQASYPSGSALTIVATPAATSLFAGWGGACAASGTATTCNLTINANSTVSATFNLPTLSVVVAGTGTVTSNPAGINCGATCTASFNMNTAITFTATGANFSGWSGGGCAGMGTCIVTLTQNTTVTANFGVAGLPSFAQAALEAYVKASNTGPNDDFGGIVPLPQGGTLATVALSGDTLVVGAPREDSAAIGVNGDQANNSAFDSGAVYVFTRTGGVWSQQAYVKASNTGVGDRFGTSVALAGDTLAVGAFEEASAATEINGNQADNSAFGSGAVYVFTRTGGVWSQQAYVKASNTEALDRFGISVALAGDTLAVGAFGEASAATGINGNQADNSAFGSGAVYVFTRTGGVWSQQAYVKASNPEIGDQFGISVSLSGDTLAVGASREGSAATGVNGDQVNNGASASGAVYVFTRTGGVWSQQAYVKASNTGALDQFGNSVILSSDTLAVGAYFESSNAIGVNGDQANNGAGSSGAVYVFTRTGGVWSQQAYVKASNTGASDAFGISVALSGDTLAVGAFEEDSTATGVNGDQANNGAGSSGAVYVFTRTGGVWSQQAYVKASNTGASDAFGISVALSGDTLVVGAPGEASAATGLNGNQADDSSAGAGAAYIYRAQ